MKQTKPFSATITKGDKEQLEKLSQEDGIQRGIFFDTSGKAHMEHVNKSALYNYLFKTRKEMTK